MTLTITSLRVDAKGNDVPFLVVNCVFKCDRDPGSYDFLWNQAKAWSEEYHKVLTVDDPERYEEWICSHWDLKERYDGYGKAWVHEDPQWRRIEKFDCFWFRQWVADCTVTRAIVAELEHYKKHRTLPSVYRAVEGSIILSHLRTLGQYWD